MSAAPALTLLPARAEGAGESSAVAAEKVVAGEPRQTAWVEFEDAAGFCVGWWRGEPGEWRVAYTEREYCRIVEGTSVVTDAAGRATTLRAGDEFVVPAGFAGTWRVVETTLKRFVVHETPAP